MIDADLIIIGAGPAGMSAAACAANAGASVLMLDEQPQAGGQVYRNAGASRADKPWLGKAYRAGAGMIDGLDNAHITTEFGATVWRIEQGPRVAWSRGGKSQISSASNVLLATGAQERPMPFQGWTLPGVMPAGAAQILMKTSGLLPRDAVLAGSGPLLYQIAAQMIDAGAPPKALVETQTRQMMRSALKNLPKALIGTLTLPKGLALLWKIRATGVKRYRSTSDFVAVQSDGGDIAFSFTANGRTEQIDCALLLTHQGVIPSTHMTRSADITHEWNGMQNAFQPVADEWGQTNVAGLHIAGDGAGIGGAEAAAAEGRLAALDILHSSGRLSKTDRNKQARAARNALRRARSIRPFLDTAYAPLPEFMSPADETIICRCEEVTAAQVRETIHEGATGHRQIKTSIRAGMGPCQGRMCDPTVLGILMASDNASQETLSPARARTPIKPIMLGELAAMQLNHEEKV